MAGCKEERHHVNCIDGSHGSTLNDQIHQAHTINELFQTGSNDQILNGQQIEGVVIDFTHSFPNLEYLTTEQDRVEQ